MPASAFLIPRTCIVCIPPPIAWACSSRASAWRSTRGRIASVIGISSEDVIDSFTILGVLTGQAAAWAAQRVNPQELASLRELAAEVAARSGDDSIGEANWRFHQEIHRAAHSRRLLAQLTQAARMVPTNFLTLFPEHEKHSLDEHDELIEAIADHDAERARSVAESHVLEAGRSLASWLDQR